MATRDDYNAVIHVILRDLDTYVNKYVPDFAGYRQQALNAMPTVAYNCGKDAVDVLDALRAKNAGESNG